MIDITDIRARTERWRAKHRASLPGSPSPLTQAHRDRDELLWDVDRLRTLERTVEDALSDRSDGDAPFRARARGGRGGLHGLRRHRQAEGRPMTLRAVTLLWPWPWMICHAGKRIENRGWRPPDDALGKPLAIHGGKLPPLGDRMGDAAYEKWEEIRDTVIDLRDEGLLPPEPKIPLSTFAAQSGCVVCIGILAGWIQGANGICRAGATDADREAVRRARETPGPWYCGPYGWVLRDLVVLPEPVPCRGAQGLWAVPEPALSAVREGYRRARAA